jgi:hypothetical protein
MMRAYAEVQAVTRWMRLPPRRESMTGIGSARTSSATTRGAVAAALFLAAAVSSAAPPPAGARRESPPPGIEATAVAIGATAPSFELPAADGRRFALPKVLARGPVVVVFYRGYW